MNKNIYRLVFSKHLSMFVPAPEFARSHSAAKSSRTARRRALAIAAAANLIVANSAMAGGLPIPCPGGACGVHANIPKFVSSGSASYSTSGTTGTVVQTSSKAILNWKSFNVDAGSTMNFQQVDAAGNPNRGAATLNRIWDANPSTIAGALNSYGQLYLINQNGIIFANGAQVNASSLVASTLDISDDVFNSPAGIYSSPDGSSPIFALGDGYQASFIQIDNGANLSTAEGGLLMVLAPTVTNNGNLTANGGQIIAAAGDKVYLALPPNVKAEDLPTDSPLRGLAGLMVEVDSSSLGAAGGSVTNGTLGKMIADRGNITVAALAVNQMGRISATTSVNSKGSIRLLARDTKTMTQVNGADVITGQRGGTLTLGEGSVTEVRPDFADGATVPANQTFNPSTVELAGKTIEMRDNASIVVPGGGVTLTAQANFLQFSPDADSGSRIYFGKGSLIDTSGTENVTMSMDQNFVEAELRGTELQDSPLLRNSVLRGKKVWVDIREGTPLANVSGYINAVKHGIGELTASGGSVKVVSEGDIVSRAGSSIDVSGGWLNYSGGFDKSTQLISNGRIYDIGEATPDRIYDGLANEITLTYGKWGVSQTYTINQRGRYLPGYVEGKNAGSVSFVAPAMAIEGTLVGDVRAGENQRAAGKVPTGAKLTVGDISRQAAPQDILITSSPSSLPGSFDFSSTLSDSAQQTMTIAPEVFGSFSQLDFSAFSSTSDFSSISVAQGTNLTLPAGGTLSFKANTIDIQGNISVPAGDINLISTAGPVANVAASSQIGLTVGDGVTLSTRGAWVNDSLVLGALPMGSALVDGGDITLTSVMGVSLGEGSLLDVSGGGWLKSDGKLVKGDGGDLTIDSNRGQPVSSQIAAPLLLGGELRGNALGTGGELTISAANVQVGNVASGAEGEVLLDPSFFRSGFSSYSITGRDGLTVQDGTSVQPQMQNLVLASGYKQKASGTDIYSFSKVQTLPEYLRGPADISLTVDNVLGGNLVIGTGAGIYTDAGADISLKSSGQLTVKGTLAAPAGTINLALTGVPGSDNDTGFNAGQSVWLGADSQLLARGHVVTQPDANGLRKGELLSGGTVKIQADKGYVVSEAGSLIDVSGVSTVLDLPAGNGIAPTTLHSDAGSIAIGAREGFILAGEMTAKAGGNTASGGSLSLTVDTKNNHPINPANPYPTNPRQVIVTSQSVELPDGLQAQQAIDKAQYNGKGLVSASAISAGGFDQLAIKGEDAIVLDGDMSLALSRSVKFDAPRLDVNGNVSVTTAYAEVANKSQLEALQKAQAPTAGSHTLAVDAKLIDFTGNVTLDGVSKATFSSQGDIRFNSTVMSAGSSGYELKAGSLTTSADLDFVADQLYPSTNASYTVNVVDAVNNPTGTVRILPGKDASMVLSAVGQLTMNAKNIEQSGIIKAPFGKIALNATEKLTLSSGSVTSTSANGLMIPYGRTQLSGQDYVYNIGASNLLVDGLADKSVTLKGNEVDSQAGSVVDISGGGDLFAYEFIAGPGGSKDVLDPANAANTFAIMPTLGGSFAPSDIQESAGLEGLSVGDQVYLSASPGLAAGYYTLLPARYALMEGAFLVTRLEGKQDMVPSQSYAMADGSRVVAGYYRHASYDGAEAGESVLRESRSAGFQVRPGTMALTQSEYLITKASEFFAGTSTLPADAGRLAISAKSLLNLDGKLIAATGENGQGAAVDIAADKIQLVSSDTTQADKIAYKNQDFVLVDTDKLNSLGASSLLIGGLRSEDDEGMDIDVVAKEVGVATGNKALAAPEVILAATDEVHVVNGSVNASGTATDKQKTINVSGDGALLRVANADAQLIRSNVDRQQGTLTIDADQVVIGMTVVKGATVSGKAITLDATKDNQANGKIVVAENGVLSLSAGRINMGDTTGVTEGLTLSNSVLSGFGQLSDLRLVSYSSIDLYGEMGFGNAALNLTLDSGGLVGYDNHGKTAEFTAKSIALRNSNGAVISAAPARADQSTPTKGDGTLNLTAKQITIAAGEKSLEGFGQNNLTADTVVASGVGKMDVAGNLDVTTNMVTASSAAEQSINATGKVSIAKRDPDATIDTTVESLGAKLAISGSEVSNAGAVVLTGGKASLHATSGNVVIENGGSVLATGTVRDFGDGKKVAIPAGEVSLIADQGDVTLETGSKVDVSGKAGGDAGTLEVRAAQGQLNLNGGTIAGAAEAVDAGTPKQGSFKLDVAQLPDFSTLNRALNTGGFTEKRDMRVRTGNVTVAATESGNNAVQAHQFQLSADSGAITVNGTIDASGPQGGNIGLYAGDDLTLTRGSKLLANGTADTETLAGTLGRGGNVLLSSTTGIVKAEATDAVDANGNKIAGALIDVSGDQAGNVTGQGGRVTFAAANTGTVSTVFTSAAATAVSGSAANITIPSTGYTLAAAPVIAFKFTTAPSSGAATTVAKLNVNGTGLKSLVKNDGAPVTKADIAANTVYLAKYDGTNYVLVPGDASQYLMVGNGVNVNSASTGAVKGASQVLVQANRVYDLPSGTTVDSALEATLKADAKAMAAAVDMSGFAKTRDNKSALFSTGMELRSAGDLNVKVNEAAATTAAASRGWDLNGWNVGPGTLTLRAAGNLNINGTITDGFVKSATASRAAVNWAQDTTRTAFWSYRFAAGADLSAANSLALLDDVADGKGNFTLGLGRTGSVSDPAHAIIRTGDGTIDIAAAGNVNLAAPTSVIYTAGVASLAAPVANFVAPNISVAGVNTPATYARGGGDIHIQSLGDIIASPSSQLITPWLYRQGELNEDGTLKTTQFSNSNHKQPTWWVQYNQFQQGVGALGGGNVTVEAVGDISNLSVSIPTNGRLGGANNSVPDPNSLVVQGGGNMNVSAGGDILSGIFYVGKGVGEVKVGGELGSARNSSTDMPIYNLFALGDGQFDIITGRDLNVQNVFNPTVLSQTNANAGSGILMDKTSYFFTYGEESSVDLLSLGGDVRLINDGSATASVLMTDRVNENATAASLNIYPGSVTAAAASGDIEVAGFTLFPNANGQLNLLAAQDVRLMGDTPVRMSDLAPADLPHAISPTAAFEEIDELLINASEQGFQFHASALLHANDYEPSRIVALNGSVIGKPDSTFASMAEALVVNAGYDVKDFSLIGQNMHADDITRISAGHDIVYQANRTANGSIASDSNSITVGGPGRVHMTAGHDVDLGSSAGVVTIGNFYNPYLPEYGASVFVQAGLKEAANYSDFVTKYVVTAGSITDGRNYLPQLQAYMSKFKNVASMTEDEAVAAFAKLPAERQAAFANPIFYEELKYAGRAAADPNGGSFQDYSAGEALIATLFPSVQQGDVKLFFSQIKTQQGGDIEILAPAGLVNAGLANSGNLSKTANQLGIVTVDGGDVRAMVRDDFLVNQSRVFTLGGGDILLWADQGNIDAGKGAKTTAATPAPVLRVNSQGVLELDVSQSVSGSGIGVLLAKSGITAGDVDLIAPRGEINAGDAGIRSAGNLTLAAVRVVGADNIDVGGVSTGVPVATTAGLSGSAVGVADAASSVTKSASEDVAKQVAQNSNPFDTAKAQMPSFINVEVIGLGEQKQ